MRLGIDFGTTRIIVAFVDRGNYPGKTQGPGRAQTLRALGMQGEQCLGRRDARRKAQLLDVDHLSLHGDGHRDPEHRDKEHPGQHQGHGHRAVIDNDVSAKAEIRVPPVEYPAELAVDCMQLFSRRDIGVRARPILSKPVQIA